MPALTEGHAGGFPKPTPLSTLTRTSPQPIHPRQLSWGPQEGLEQVMATFPALFPAALLEVAPLWSDWPCHPPVGAAAQASTHAGQKAEEAQADAHDDARDRVHVQRVWQGRGREQNTSRTGGNPRFIDQDILGLPQEATGLNRFLWTRDL